MSDGQETQAQDLQAQGNRPAAPLGTGERFRALEAKLARTGRSSDPAAIAAAIGRAKYGNAKMAKMAAAGRRRRAR